MPFVLATTENRMSWYSFPLKCLEDISKLKEGDYVLCEHLDRDIVTGFGNKYTANRVARAVGLKTWSYVKLDSIKCSFEIRADK